MVVGINNIPRIDSFDFQPRKITPQYFCIFDKYKKE